MTDTVIKIERLDVTIRPDITRVLLRPFAPSTCERIAKIISRVMLLSEGEVAKLLKHVRTEFSSRHIDFELMMLHRYQEMKQHAIIDIEPSKDCCLLIGSYFLCEYALEASAIFNPSMILHPDQEGLPAGSARYVISMRSTGEGHISSISFRGCVIDSEGAIEITPASKKVKGFEPVTDQHYNKYTFSMKLFELGLMCSFSEAVMNQLGETFSNGELESAINSETLKNRVSNENCESRAEEIHILARSNFRISFDPKLKLSEKVIFPHSPSQRKGIEDARFVRFVNEDDSIQYYATYTAYDGQVMLPQLLETKDFQDFRIMTLGGKAVQNKGMALFPRKLNGKYYMLSRQDNENIFLMISDDIHFWHETQRISQPSFPWQFVQLGNCGSPIETDKGWLVLSHGVGPMRKYCIGAFLLDIDDPTRVIGRLTSPLISPLDDEREGYVPNVVYSCGAVVHNELLFIPYAYSDYGSRFATVNLAQLLEEIMAK